MMKRMHEIEPSIVALLLVLITGLQAQTPADFSGKWKFDKAQSSSGLIESQYEGDVVLDITQNSTSFSMTEVWIKPGAADFETAADVYSLDGKERTTKGGAGTNKRSAQWSKDKKTLVIVNIDIQTTGGVRREFLTQDSYAVSDDGKTLAIDRYTKNPVTGETHAKKIYHKQ